MTSKYRPTLGKTPCKACPFRQKAMPGFLGTSPPEQFTIAILMEQPLPCHLTINYDNKNWNEKWLQQRIGKICAGSLIMSANMAKIPRDPSFPRLPADKETVFATFQEFIDYHNGAPVKSWEE